LSPLFCPYDISWDLCLRSLGLSEKQKEAQRSIRWIQIWFGLLHDLKLLIESSQKSTSMPSTGAPSTKIHKNSSKKRPPTLQAIRRKMSDVSGLIASESDDLTFASEESDELMENNPNRMRMTGSFILNCFLVSVCLAYASGRVARLLFIDGPRNEIIAEYKRRVMVRERRIGANPFYKTHLPPLVAKDGELIPHTRYSSKIFDTSRRIASSSWLMTSDNVHWIEGDEELLNAQKTRDECEANDSIECEEEKEEEEEESQPVGEHLMVDFKNVERSFLESESRLVRAMLDLIEEADLELLSYHCHTFAPSSVSCVGVLLQNYFAFHTWPDWGVVTFDLCTTESKSVLRLLSSIQQLFGVPRTPSYPGEVVKQPEARWTHKFRGFRHDDTEVSKVLLLTDLGVSLVDFGSEIKQEASSSRCCDIHVLRAYHSFFFVFLHFRSLRSRLTSSGSISTMSWTPTEDKG